MKLMRNHKERETTHSQEGEQITRQAENLQNKTIMTVSFCRNVALQTSVSKSPICAELLTLLVESPTDTKIP